MFDWNLRDWLSPETLGMIMRSAALLLFGLPALYFASRWLRTYLTRKQTAQHGMIASKVLGYVGLAIIIFSLLNELGFKLTHIVAAAGVIGVAVGFAAQTSFSNIISGFFLIAEQPFVVGDIISVGTATGEVLSIDMLSIKLRTFENKFVRIPNETILNSEVTNFTRFPIRRIDLNVGVAYKEDLERVKKILFEIVNDNPLCLQEPTPDVRFVGFGSSSIDLLVVVWVERTEYLRLKTIIQEQIKKRFDEEGIEIPFPHVSVYKGSVSDPFPVQMVGSDENTEGGAV